MSDSNTDAHAGQAAAAAIPMVHAPLTSRTQSLPAVRALPRGHAALQRTFTTANVTLPSPPQSTFSHKDYCPAPEVVYTTSLEDANIQLSRLQGPVLGFDMEWPYSCTWVYRRRVERIGRTALIQVCDKNLIVMIHLMTGNNTRLPQKLIEIMQDPEIYKCGVQVRGDGIKLWLDFPGAFPNGIKSLLELSNIARCVDPDNAVFAAKPAWENKLVGLKDQTLAYLGKCLDKNNNERQSNWAIELNEKQIDYAANDAYASLNIYFHLANLARDQCLRLILDNCSNNITSEGDHYRGPIIDPKTVRHGASDNPNDGGFLPDGLYGCEHADNLDWPDYISDTETEVDDNEVEEDSGTDRRKRRRGSSGGEGQDN